LLVPFGKLAKLVERSLILRGVVTPKMRREFRGEISGVGWPVDP
jgi:hypothetical protein